MELLLSDIDGASFICEEMTAVKDVQHWKNVTVNDQGEVTVIDWDDMRLAGTMNFDCIPSTAVVVKIGWNQLNGSLHLAGMPPFLEILHLRNNKLHGSMDLRSLPDGLQDLNLSTNRFSGSIDLRSLPKNLHRLSMSNNQLRGEMVEWLAQGYVHSVTTSIPAHAV